MSTPLTEQETITVLEDRVKELESALRQYADLGNWGYYDESGCEKGHGEYTDACFLGPELAQAIVDGDARRS